MHFVDFCDFSAGWWAGFTTVPIGHPLETIKVRMHILGDQGIRATARNVRDLQGMRGFYKGMTVSVFHSAANASISYGLYSFLHRKILYEGHMACCEHTIHNVSYLHSKLFACGMAGGLTNVLLSCPVELIKTRQQIHGINHNITPVQSVIHVYKAGRKPSVKNFYLGVGPMCLRDGPPFGVFVVIQEHLECLLRHQLSVPTYMSDWATFVSGGLAGISFQVVGIPFDVIKSRMMTDRLDRPVYRGMIHCFRKTRQEYGLRIFYHGGLPAMMRAFLVNAIGLVLYDHMVERCLKLNTFF